MKKWFCYLFVSIVMLGFLTACNNSPADSNQDIESQEGTHTDADSVSTDQSDASSAILPKAVAMLNETAILPSLRINAQEIQTTFGDPFLIKKANPILYVCVKCELENTSAKMQVMSSYAQIHATVDGAQAKYAPAAAIFIGDGESAPLDAELAPGEKHTGWYCVDSREGAKSMTMTFRDSLLSQETAKIAFDVPQ